jgi:hypothetical protein
MDRAALFVVVLLPSIALAQETLPGEQRFGVHLVVLAPLKPGGLRQLVRLHEQPPSRAAGGARVHAPVHRRSGGGRGARSGAARRGIALASIGTVFGVTVGMILVASGAAIALVGILVAVTSGVRLAEIERREDELHQLLLMQF